MSSKEGEPHQNVSHALIMLQVGRKDDKGCLHEHSEEEPSANGSERNRHDHFVHDGGRHECDEHSAHARNVELADREGINVSQKLIIILLLLLVFFCFFLFFFDIQTHS